MALKSLEVSTGTIVWVSRSDLEYEAVQSFPFHGQTPDSLLVSAVQETNWTLCFCMRLLVLMVTSFKVMSYSQFHSRPLQLNILAAWGGGGRVQFSDHLVRPTSKISDIWETFQVPSQICYFKSWLTDMLNLPWGGKLEVAALEVTDTPNSSEINLSSRGGEGNIGRTVCDNREFYHQ